MRARPFELVMPDGLTLRGESHPAGLDWVVMLHDVGRDLDCWRPLIDGLASVGHSIASLDLRGHGASDGEPDEAIVLGDLAPILTRIRPDVPGALIVVAAGKVGAALLDEHVPIRPDALVLLSPQSARDPRELRGEGMPKLFFVGALDPEMDRFARELRNSSVGHAGVVSFPTRDQGADLLREPWLSHLVDHAAGFARGVASGSSTTNSTGGRA